MLSASVAQWSVASSLPRKASGLIPRRNKYLIYIKYLDTNWYIYYKMLFILKEH